MPTILIAEDEPTVLLLAESILVDSGYDVLTASDGSQALALLNDTKPDVLITDINMGEGPDGHAVAEAAIARYPKLPVIYASSVVVTDGLKARLVDGSAFIAKPYDMADLIAAVEKALAAPNS